MFPVSNFRLTCLIACLVFAGTCGDSEPTSAANPAITFKEKWTVLHIEKKPSPAPKVIPNKSPLKSVFNLEFTGSQQDQPYLLGKFNSTSAWFIQNGYLQPVEARNSAIKLGTAEDFELQGIIKSEGPGGWFILLGWNNQNGYMISAVTLKTSGSPWHLEEIKKGQGLPDSHQEFIRYDWKGDQPFRMTLKKKTLSISVGKTILLDGQFLPNYQTGELILGAYETPYGPKPFKIRSLRVHSKKTKVPVN